MAVRSSEVTVRRDIQALESCGLVDRRRGGAALPGGLSHELSYRQKSLVAASEKASIAEAAVMLLEEGDAIVIGAGTTAEGVHAAFGVDERPDGADELLVSSSGA